MPKAPILNYEEAFRSDPNSTVMARLDIVDGNNNQATAVLNVSSFIRILTVCSKKRKKRFFNCCLLRFFAGYNATILST
jgi:hypothetical protein